MAIERGDRNLNTYKYLNDALQLSMTEYIIAAVVLVIGIVFCLYLWRKAIEKRGKKPTLLIVFIFAIVFLPITILSLIPMDSTLILGVVFIAGVAAILGGWYLFPYIVYADVPAFRFPVDFSSSSATSAYTI